MMPYEGGGVKKTQAVIFPTVVCGLWCISLLESKNWIIIYFCIAAAVFWGYPSCFQSMALVTRGFCYFSERVHFNTRNYFLIFLERCFRKPMSNEATRLYLLLPQKKIEKMWGGAFDDIMKDNCEQVLNTSTAPHHKQQKSISGVKSRLSKTPRRCAQSGREGAKGKPALVREANSMREFDWSAGEGWASESGRTAAAEAPRRTRT